ncbi:hypothetical protein P1A22_11365 [Staphylococcus equorum]|nr:hypothetical protein [Staphylococcus equorum]MDK9872505.1 hypothetical protein [Staphylococcus equorum]
MAKKIDTEITTLITHKKPKAVVSEKLFEELLNKDEIHPEQAYEKIYRGKVQKIEKEELYNKIDDFLINESVRDEIIFFVNNNKMGEDKCKMD